MYLPNTASQAGLHRSLRADGSVLTVSLLVLPVQTSRAALMVQNISARAMWLEHGCARAHATITGGVVTSVTVDNGGFGFTRPPSVTFIGGGGSLIASSAWTGLGQWATPAPSGPTARPAMAHAVLTTGVVTSIVIDDPGAGYVNPPEVSMVNDPTDPFGCADPSVGSGSGILLAANGGAYSTSPTACHTDAIALWTGTGTSKFTLEYMV